MRRCLLREFWNDIIIPNFISKKQKTNYGRHYVYDYAKFLLEVDKDSLLSMDRGFVQTLAQRDKLLCFVRKYKKN